MAARSATTAWTGSSRSRTSSCSWSTSSETPTPRAAALLDQRPRRERLAARLRPVVDEQHAVAAADRRALELVGQLPAAPVRLRELHRLRAGMDRSGLPDRARSPAPRRVATPAPKTKPRASTPATFVTAGVSNGSASAATDLARKPASDEEPEHVGVTADPAEAREQLLCEARHRADRTCRRWRGHGQSCWATPRGRRRPKRSSRASSAGCATRSARAAARSRASWPPRRSTRATGEDWERLEEALIQGDVGVRATAELVRRLEARNELGDLGVGARGGDRRDASASPPRSTCPARRA